VTDTQGKATTSGGGAGDPSAFVDALVQAVKQPPTEPAPDPTVAAAFALGWQMAELYRPGVSKAGPPAAHGDLPGLGRLTAAQRADISFKQVQVAVSKLSQAVTGAHLEVPAIDELKKCLDASADLAARQQAVLDVHTELLAVLTAADFRLGKAYGLGRALADTCRNPVSAVTVLAEFRSYRIATLRGWLDDLASALPAHAGHSVSESLSRWVTALTPDQNGQRPVAPEEALRALGRQGQLWRSLLSGEKAGTDMLEVSNYLDAASRLFRTSGRIVWRFVLHFWYVVIAAIVLAGVGVLLLVNASSLNSGSVVAGAGSILASLGLTWKSVGTALGGLGAKMEQHLWGAEVDTAITDAITMLPVQQRASLLAIQGGDHAKRRELAVGTPSVPVPQPQLLAPVLDPKTLRDKIDSVADQRAQHGAAAALPGGPALPTDHFEMLRKALDADVSDPHRVVRAQTPPDPHGPPAPPPVIYIARDPGVSQFQSVITHCVEAELVAPLDRELHLSALEHLWRDIERWVDDLRSRFRAFGPCDIRFIEPKLAQLLADLDGRHPFVTKPATVGLGETAIVFVVGDWATGLPQARNVAARIREQLQRVPSGVDVHVIHLGDTYYSGLEDEVRRRFLDLWPVAPAARVRSWSIPGNHDMYSGGHGYYEVLLADPRFNAQQRCSYFSLRNDYWQILGLDSSYKNPDVADLEEPQSAWLTEQVSRPNAPGTVLLTHHQAFSAYEEVTAPLAATVAHALGGRQLDAWLWGHEHRCAVYHADARQDDNAYQANAKYAAVVGHGGVPNLLADQQAGVNQDLIDWALLDGYQVGDDRWGLGGFAVLTFDGPRLQIQYYDEYGLERRDGDPRVYRAESAGVESVMAAGDSRDIRQPDTLMSPVTSPPTSPTASWRSAGT
jgi:hypothetical protein